MTNNFDLSFRDDPWNGIEQGTYPNSARRLYKEDDRFWVSRDELGRRLMFVEEHGNYTSTFGDKVAFVEIQHFQTANGKTRACCILEDDNLNDMFALVVKDIAFRCSTYSGQMLFEKYYQRLKAWGSFLKPARTGIGFKGLIGFLSELYVLKEIFLKNLPAKEAIEAWCGPDGKHQDFLFNGLAIEVKSSLYGEKKQVQISSEHQLDVEVKTGYLLHIVLSPSILENSECITSLVSKIEEMIDSSAQAKSDFWVKISNSFGKATTNELETRFSIMEANVYAIDQGFPRIIPSNLEFTEISNVKYRLDLTHLPVWGGAKQLMELIEYGKFDQLS